MRKLFTLFTMLVVALGVAATNVVTSISDYASANSWSNGTQYKTIAMDANISLEAVGGSNTGKYYTNGNSWRLYQNEQASIKITAANGAALQSVTFTYTVSSTGTLLNAPSDEAVEISGTSAEFSVGNTGEATNGQVRITAISVTYTDGGQTIAAPVISVAGSQNSAGAYTEDATVTFSHSDATAEFHYTLDGTAPTANSTSGASVVVAKQAEPVVVSVIAVINGTASLTASKTLNFGEADVEVDGTEDEITGADITAEKAASYVEVNNITKSSGAVYFAQAAYTTDGYVQLRSSNSNSGIVSTTSGGKIAKVTVDWSANSASGRTIQVYGKATAYTNPTELYNSATQGDLLGEIVYGTSNQIAISGDYEYVGIRSKNGALYANFTLTWGAGEEVAVATPVITPALATVVESQEVTITCATDGAQIYYNINSDDTPDANSTLYTGPFTVTETSVIKAIAINGNDKSKVASASITIVEPVTIADANEWTENKTDQVVKLTNAKVLYVANSGKDIYVREGDNAIMFYNTGLELSANDVLNGTVTFNFSYYYGIPEFTKNTATSLDNVVVTASDEAAAPVVTTVSEIAGLQHRCDLVTIKGEALVISDSKYYFVNDATNDTIQLYDKYGTGALADLTEGTKYDVVGLFGNIYKGQSELYVISMAEASDVKLGDVNGDGNVDVSDVVALANYVMGESSEQFNAAVADLNGVDGIDVADVVALAGMVMGN